MSQYEIRNASFGGHLTTLIATSVVRGSHQGESHGGVYLIDIDNQRVAQAIDWNTANIDWSGRGADRGLRGIAYDGAVVYITASDELFAYTPTFERIGAYRNPCLKHCHEIAVYKRRLYLTSTGYDSILGFDLDARKFSWGLHIERVLDGYNAVPFLPRGGKGPPAGNRLHLNNVHADRNGLFISGLKTAGLLRYSGNEIVKCVQLPDGVHNAQPFQDGVVFNDTQADVVRFISKVKQRIFRVPSYPQHLLTNTDLDDSRTARQAFARGLCAIDNHTVAGGSSPSTITIHDFESMKTTLTINLTMDIRNAIHGLEIWPYDT